MSQFVFDAKVDATIERLKKIISGRFNCEIAVLPATDSQLTQTSVMLSDEGDIYLSITHNTIFLSRVIIYKGSSLYPSDQRDLIELCFSVLEPVLYSRYLNMNPDAAPEFLKSENVISINSKRHETLKEETLDVFEDIDSEESYFEADPIEEMASFENPIQSKFVVLEGAHPELISKTARQIHEISGNWAQVNYQDIKSEMKSFNEILNLGPITIFVSDILDLSPMEREWVLDLQKNPPAHESPLFIIGSVRPLDMLLQSSTLEFHATEKFKRHLISLKEIPSDFTKRQETLEMLLTL